MALKQENVHDVRMVRRHINRGKIEKTTWQKHLEALPDLAELAEPSEVVFEHTTEEAGSDDN